MAGKKGMVGSGGARVGAGRPLTESPRKNQIRVTDEEKKLIALIREKNSLNKILNYLQSEKYD